MLIGWQHKSHVTAWVSDMYYLLTVNEDNTDVIIRMLQPDGSYTDHRKSGWSARFDLYRCTNDLMDEYLCYGDYRIGINCHRTEKLEKGTYIIKCFYENLYVDSPYQKFAMHVFSKRPVTLSKAMNEKAVFNHFGYNICEQRHGTCVEKDENPCFVLTAAKASSLKISIMPGKGPSGHLPINLTIQRVPDCSHASVIKPTYHLGEWHRTDINAGIYVLRPNTTYHVEYDHVEYDITFYIKGDVTVGNYTTFDFIGEDIVLSKWH
jgi:hypothetical protein